ncbi:MULTISPECIES: hypothetical protein [unclassified Streptomyces]|uniref:hypothetical protein n=1 Tax=unclassified Streptomyces TaxID=2593676 RepID=UPI00159F2F43|nr:MULTISPECIES: hypothetical protein [unclassified Streptomyces]
MPFTLVELTEGFQAPVEGPNSRGGGGQQQAVGVDAGVTCREVRQEPDLLQVEIVLVGDLPVEPGVGVFA